MAAYTCKSINHIWVLWRRGAKSTDVLDVIGIYKLKSDAMTNSERSGADGLTPVTDKLLAKMWVIACPHLLEKAHPYIH